MGTPRTEPDVRRSRIRLPLLMFDDEALIGPRVKDAWLVDPGLPCTVILAAAREVRIQGTTM